MERDFWESSELIEIPNHIVALQKLLREFHGHSRRGIRESVEEIKKCAEECGFCAVCRGCSQRFYDSIIRKELKEKSLPFELENYFVMPAQMYYYKKSMQDSNEYFHLKDRMVCLKGFSSSTPTLHSLAFSSECTGGGLYINYKGIGIVIDPGIGFVSSMHTHGIYINNIDIVIITHDDLDHNADAKVISSLLHDLNRYNQRKGKIVKKIFKLERNQETYNNMDCG